MRIKDTVASAHFPHGDAEIILAHLCGKPRTWIMAHGEHALAPEEERLWDAFRKRREQGEPVAYITGEKEFFGRSFFVDSSVLIPRPSTERLVEMVLKILCRRVMVSLPVRKAGPSNHDISVSPFDELRMTHSIHSSIPLDAGIIGISEVWGPRADIHTIVDVGTGSGCIAITLACALPEMNIVATDISMTALTLASTNAKRHGVGERICFMQGSLLEPVMDIQKPFLLVSNPPYILEKEKLPYDVAAYEPSRALRAGPDGRSVLRPLLAAARLHPACRGFVVECQEDQIDEKTVETDNALL